MEHEETFFMSQFLISSQLDQKEVYIKKMVQDGLAPFRVFADYFTFSPSKDVANVIKRAYI